MRNVCSIIFWTLIACVGTGAFALLALHRGESISAAWVLTAAFCTWAIGYRFYSRIISHRIFALDDQRPTPALRLNDGHDFVPTNSWVVFGHHFAAIAGAGPLVGPILAAQFGYLPGTIWIIVGVVVAGAVQDLVILCASLRHDGKSLGHIAKETIGPLAGWVTLFAVMAILSILIAVLAMVVVNAMADSPWSTVSVGLTIPIAMLMGLWMRILRPGRVLEASVIGVLLLGIALWAGYAVHHLPVDHSWRQMLTFGREMRDIPLCGAIQGRELLSWIIIGYGFIAAVLPVWLLLAPRDYLSAFVKIGTIVMLALGIIIVMPSLHMPALMSAETGTAIAAKISVGDGPVQPGSLLPFAFITIACGAISGFHALIASGTTPKLLTNERHARAIGYGGMLMESFVAILALIAACALTPGVYFAMNTPAALLGTDMAAAVHTINSWGFTVTADDLTQLANGIGEQSVLSRTGGAPTLAVGMAMIFDQATRWLGLADLRSFWYHFAIMFEALFILTTIDAGTRVGRFIFQDVAGHLWKPLGDYSRSWAAWLASAIMVSAWAWFLIAGVRDPLGGIYMLWPLFGIANQLLAVIALTVGTVVIIRAGKQRFAWITMIPLCWLLFITETAGWQKLTNPNPKISFLAAATAKDAEIENLNRDILARSRSSDPTSQQDLHALITKRSAAQHIALNNRIDAVLCALFMIVIAVVVVDAARVSRRLLKNPSP